MSSSSAGTSVSMSANTSVDITTRESPSENPRKSKGHSNGMTSVAGEGWGWTVLLRREWALALALLALLASLSLPPFPTSRTVHRLLITFDLSQSMGVEDVTLEGDVVSRLTLAKAAAARLVADLPCGSEVGWAGFVERRTTPLATPLEVCEHYEGLLSSLELIDGRMRWGEASGIGKGLHQVLRAASEIGEETAIVMFSDGQEAPPLKSGQTGLPKSEGLEIGGVLIGVGGTTPVPIPKIDAAGRQVGFWQADDVAQAQGATAGERREELSRLDGEHLATLARLAGLEYRALSRPTDLLAALDASGLGKPTRVPTEWGWLPAVLALLALAWRFWPGLRPPLGKR